MRYISVTPQNGPSHETSVIIIHSAPKRMKKGSPRRGPRAPNSGPQNHVILVNIAYLTFAIKTCGFLMIFKMYTNAHMRFCYKNRWFFNDFEIPGGALGSIFLFFSENVNITWDQWKMTICWRYKYSENVTFIGWKSCVS